MGNVATDHLAEGNSSVIEYVESVLSGSDLEKSGAPNQPVPEVRPEPKRGWRNLIWDSLDKSPEERRLIQKIDLSLLTLGCLSQYLSITTVKRIVDPTCCRLFREVS